MTKKDQLKKIKLYNDIFRKNFGKNEKFVIIKKNCESDVEYYRTDFTNRKIAEKVLKNSEKNEISKFAEISKNKIDFNKKREKLYNYVKVGKNIEERNDKNDHKEKFIYQEKENKNNNKRKKKYI